MWESGGCCYVHMYIDKCIKFFFQIITIKINFYFSKDLPVNAENIFNLSISNRKNSNCFKFEIFYLHLPIKLNSLKCNLTITKGLHCLFNLNWLMGIRRVQYRGEQLTLKCRGPLNYVFELFAFLSAAIDSAKIPIWTEHQPNAF